MNQIPNLAVNHQHVFMIVYPIQQVSKSKNKKVQKNITIPRERRLLLKFGNLI